MSIFSCKRSNSHVAWKVAGTVAIAAVAAGLIVNFKSIRRYIKISLM
jgi:hypothetical protein